MNQSPPFVPLCHVRTLKLRGTDISDVGVAELLKPCARTLERLDIGYTHVGETGGLDVLALALGLEMRVVYPTGPGGRYEDPDPNGGRHSISTGTRLKKLSLSGLTLHPGSLTSFLRAVLHEKPPCELQTLHLADMKERTTATTGTRNLSSTSRPSLSCLTLEAAVTGPLSALISARDYAQRQARLSKSDGPDAIPEKPQPPEPPRDPPLFTKLVLSGNPRLGHDHPLRPGALENPLGDLVRVAGKDCKVRMLVFLSPAFSPPPPPPASHALT